jgi:hypothetical protein
LKVIASRVAERSTPERYGNSALMGNPICLAKLGVFEIPFQPLKKAQIFAALKLFYDEIMSHTWKINFKSLPLWGDDRFLQMKKIIFF